MWPHCLIRCYMRMQVDNQMETIGMGLYHKRSMDIYLTYPAR
ncbi:Protein of unknown function [Gryllus bimaculatus]|nr:Protein of unknown function [Gryllus bimaculatus]